MKFPWRPDPAQPNPMGSLSPLDQSVFHSVVADNDAYDQAVKIWRRLGAGPWEVRSRDAGGFVDPLVNELVDLATEGIPPNLAVRDYASAGPKLRSLVAAGFIHAERRDNGTITYTKASQAPPRDTRSWVERSNDELKRRQTAADKLMREQGERQARLLEQEREHYEAPQRAQLVRLLHDVVGDDLRTLTGLNARLDAIEARLGKIEREAG